MQHPDPDSHLNSIKPIHHSIIIVIYNSLPYLERCFNSLSKEIDSSCEVIIVDNASSDHALDFIEQNFSSFKIIRNTENIGFAAACNRGADFASGEILVYLNPDTEVCPGWLANLTQRLEQDNSVAITNSKIMLLSNPDKIGSCGLDIHFTGLSFARDFMRDQNAKVESRYIQAISGTSFAARKDMWDKLGGFDERFFMYFEDVDLSWRAQLAGYKCLLAQDSVLYHRRTSRPSDISLYYNARNRLFMLIKNYRWATLFLLLPGILLVELIDWLYFLSFGFKTFKVKLRSYGWLITHLAVLNDGHHENQKLRRIKDAEIIQMRISELKPSEVTGGVLGRILIRGVNWLLRLYHTLCIFALRSLGL